MRLAVRALIVLSLPIVAFGWLSSAATGPAPAVPPAEGALGFAVAVTALVLACGVRHAPRISAALGVLVVIGTGNMVDLGYEGGDMLLAWLAAVLVVGGLFVGLMAAIVLVRSLAAMWASSDLAMWPGRDLAIAVVLLAAFVATPVQVGEPDPFDFDFFVGGPPYLVPLAEMVRVEFFGGSPVFLYPDAW
jgi:hypothetical protein